MYHIREKSIQIQCVTEKAKCQQKDGISLINLLCFYFSCSKIKCRKKGKNSTFKYSGRDLYA